MMDAKLKNLTILFTDVELILHECRELKANLSLELQAARDDRRAQHKEFQEVVSELKDTLIKIQSQFKIEAQLLNLIGLAGEDEWPQENTSSRCRTLDVLSKKTH